MHQPQASAEWPWTWGRSCRSGRLAGWPEAANPASRVRADPLLAPLLPCVPAPAPAHPVPGPLTQERICPRPSLPSCLSLHLPAASEFPDPGPEPEGAGPGEDGHIQGARGHGGCPGCPGDRPHRAAPGRAPHAGGRVPGAGTGGGRGSRGVFWELGCRGGRDNNQSRFFSSIRGLPQNSRELTACQGRRQDGQTERG